MTRRSVPVALAALTAAALVSSCTGGADGSGDVTRRSGAHDRPGGGGEPSSPEGTSTGSAGRPTVAGVVARNLTSPWGLDFLPNGDALVTERDTRRVLLLTSEGRVAQAGTVPEAQPDGEGGLLGVAVSPEFGSDRTVFLYYSAGSENRIARYTLDRDGRLSGGTVILDGIPAAGFHNGGRLEFGPDGMLYAGTGEGGVPSRSQDRDSLGGKILRMTPEGRPPEDNPFPGSVVFSWGHRNVQGLAFDEQGRLWASEFGQDRWDELNLVRPGGNYGWPHVEGRESDPRFVNPEEVWTPDEASPSGVAHLGDAVYMAGLRGERLWQIPTGATGTGDPRAYFAGRYGRLRTVVVAPDGALWLVTSNTDGRGSPHERDDRILRVVVR